MRPHNPYTDDAHPDVLAEIKEALKRRLGERESDIFLCYVEFFPCLVSAYAQRFIWPKLLSSPGDFQVLLATLIREMGRSNNIVRAETITQRITREEELRLGWRPL